MAVRCCLAAALVLAAGAHGSSEQAASRSNPLRKVVTLLQTMQKKVTTEGEAEKDLFEKFMCYCKTGGGDLSSSISSADSKVPAVGSEIEAAEATMSDAADKRAQNSKSLTEKDSFKADFETALQGHGEAKKSAVSELMATDKYISSLHAECDWLLQYFDVRKAARADEVDALTRAKAVLSGADYSLLQTSARRGGFMAKRS
mmetsp:Transcript_98776/g.260712  ORF Transcript_98776/g.260712 Transcript_98776/m.260712 type:complete len:202 (-) Transcript_98776:92-697(-)